MLRNFIAIAAFCMTALAAPFSNSTSAGTTEQTTTKLSVNIFDSAIFVCGDYLYKESLSMLFPPSDQSLPNIKNSTRAKIVHTQSYKHFCSKIDTYTACVQLLVKRNFSPVDDQLKHYIDLENFPTAMSEFCSNESLVTDQFMCTKGQSESFSCPYGGIYGVMKYVSMATRDSLPRKQYCDEFKASIRCRVDKQLKPCNKDYATLMEGVYQTLVRNTCKMH